MAKKGEEFKCVDEILEKNIKEGNISLILDSYEDIFSDFDPRPYTEKALSDDFINECMKAARDKKGRFELRLMVPHNLRNLKEELKVRKRLKEHFNKHYEEKKKEMDAMKKQGMLWFAMGMILMIISSFFYDREGFIYHLLLVIFEPAGWFSFWEGLDKVFIYSKEHEPELKFNKKMAECHIYFFSY
ncbi:hypothetical protein JW756_04200 [Candidatus Woesearchaeota archaeon]|nr:hypothetical protein [Candidatus Woesearchaeota archaeon]